MQHLFLSYKQSLTAKEKGFDEPCLARWRGDTFQLYTIIKEHKYNSDPITTKDISAPLYQQIIMWINEHLSVKDLPLINYDGFMCITKEETDKAIEEALKLI